MTTTEIAKMRGAIAVAFDTPTVERHRSELLSTDTIASNDRLIPLDDLGAIRRELTELLKPASRSDTERCVATLVACYPQRGPAVPDIYVSAMAAELEDFPPDVLRETVSIARRTIKFLPSIAEVFEIAQDLVGERRRMLWAADRHEREHRRRQEEAEREAAQEAQRRREHRERIEAFEAKLRAALGDDAPEAGDYEIAHAAMWRNTSHRRRNTWHEALEAAKPWAARLCRRLATVVREETDASKERIAALIDEAFDSFHRGNRDDHQCAVDELLLRGASTSDRQRFIEDVLADERSAIERQVELAAANRARKP